MMFRRLRYCAQTRDLTALPFVAGLFSGFLLVSAVMLQLPVTKSDYPAMSPVLLQQAQHGQILPG